MGEQRVGEAAKAGADSLAMGAYGRSRMRETNFGGTTRSVPNPSALPALIAHRADAPRWPAGAKVISGYPPQAGQCAMSTGMVM